MKSIFWAGLCLCSAGASMAGAFFADGQATHLIAGVALWAAGGCLIYGGTGR